MCAMTRRRWSALLGVVAGLLLTFGLPATAASAHAVLVRSNPTQGTVLDAEPTLVTITFNEPIRAVVDKVRVTGPNGKRADAGKATATERDLRIPLLSGGPQGTYLVSYRIISADSHPVAGGYTFSVGQVTGTPTQTAGSGVQTDRVVAIAIAAARYVGYVGLILTVGPILILVALWPRRLPTKGPVKLAVVGLGILAVGTILELYLEIPYTGGGGLFSASGESFREVMTTPFAAANLIRLGVIAAVAAMLRPIAAAPAGKTDQTLLIILGIAGLGTWPISGHPSASTVPTLTVVADAAHLGAVSIWLGGLVMLFGFLLRKANDRELLAILPVWSGWAMFAVTVLVLAGTAQALVNIGTINALTGTTYGRLVLVKVGLLAVVIGIAAYSRRVVNLHFVPIEDPIEEGDDIEEEEAAEDTSRPRRRLRRSVIAEVVGAVVILGITSALVQTTPARTAEANVAPVGPYSQTFSTKIFKVEVDVEPAAKGVNIIHLYAFKPDQSGPQTVVQWSGTAALPSQGIEPVDIPLLGVTPDHASGQILLPNAGTWSLSFTLRISDIDEATVTAKVDVK
jgi:copper transport protein